MQLFVLYALVFEVVLLFKSIVVQSSYLMKYAKNSHPKFDIWK